MLGNRRRVVGIRQTLGPLGAQLSKFEIAEPGQRQVEAVELQFAEFEEKKFRVPTRVERHLVVGQAVRATLRFREPRQANRRYLIHFELPSRQNPAVTGDDSTLGINQHGVREAKFPDTPGDFGHLSRGMRPRIPRIRDKVLNLSILNSERSYSLVSCRRGSRARARKGVTLMRSQFLSGRASKYDR